MTNRQREFTGFVLFFVIIVAFAYIAAAFEQHTIWASVVLGIIVAALIFALVRFPNFRRFAKEAVTTAVNILSAPFAGEDSTKRRRKRVRIPREIRTSVMNRANHECQIPECHERRYLQYHHIDGNPSNSKVNNIIVLCQNHHTDAQRAAFKRESIIAWRDGKG